MFWKIHHDFQTTRYIISIYDEEFRDITTKAAGIFKDATTTMIEFKQRTKGTVALLTLEDCPDS